MSYEHVPFLNPKLGPKWSIFPKQEFFGKNNSYYFHPTIGPFYVQNFFKIIYKDLQFILMLHFLSLKWLFAQTRIFSESLI